MPGKFTLFVLLMLLSSVIYSQTNSVMVDFGYQYAPFPWNNISDPDDGQINGLYNNYGLQTNINVAVTDSFNAINSSGTQQPASALGLPPEATGDSFYGNTYLFGGETFPTGAIEFSGLDTTKQYHVTIFSSRLAGDNRETKYVATGQFSDSAYLNISNNTDSVVEFHMHPSAGGTLEIKASAGPNNNNGFGFFYLGLVKLSYTPDSAITPSLDLTSPDGGEFWQTGKTATIKWENFGNNQVILDYSTNNGTYWQNIDTVNMLQQYNWQIPATPSTNCLVRIRADTLEDQSKNRFEISQDSSSCRIVVIGSSTAAGAGASTSDSAWVSRFRTHIYAKDTRYEVENLARVGYTSYHLLPTGTSIPSGIGISIDTSRNVTKALSMNPSGIIVNLPSNDAAYGFSVQQHLDNFELIEQEASASGVYTWIWPTQPRYFTNTSTVQIQRDVRDSILAIYGKQAIDFWTVLADTNGFIDPEYDSGDGVHVNDKGHRLLFQRVMAKHPDTLCDNPSVFVPENIKEPSGEVSLYPNPFNNKVTVEFHTASAGRIHIILYDLTGRKIHSQTKDVGTAGNQKLTLQPGLHDNPDKQLVIARILISDKHGVRSRVFKLIRE